MLPGTTGPDLPILIQGLKPEQISGSKHKSQVINSSSAVLLPRFYFKMVSPSETHALDSHMTSNKKQILQKEILRHVLPKLNIQHSSLKQPLSMSLLFSLCLKQNIKPKESCILLSLFHRGCFLNLQVFLFCPPLLHLICLYVLFQILLICSRITYVAFKIAE